jgi:hypothetical protein
VNYFQNKELEFDVLFHLRKIAKICFFLQGISFLFFAFVYFTINPSNEIAIFCGIWSVVVSTAPIWYSILKRKSKLIFSGIAIFNFAPIWFLLLETILPGYDAYEYSPATYKIEALIWVSLFQIFINFFYIFFWRRVTKHSVNSFSFLNNIKIRPNTFAKLSIASFFLPLIIFLFYYGTLDGLWNAITAGRADGNSGGLLMQDSIGGSNSFLLPMNWLWQLTPLFAAIAFVSFKQKSNIISICALVFGIAVIFQSFLGGTRSTMIFVSTPFLFFLFFYNWNQGIKFWIYTSIILIAVVGVMEFQLRFRNEKFLDVLSHLKYAERTYNLKSATTFDFTQSHRDNNMYLFCLLLKEYPKNYGYEGFHEFFAVLANPVPRAFWPNKPIMQGAKDLVDQYPAVSNGPLEMGTTSLTYSIVGEAYMENGIWGIILYTFIYSIFLLFIDGIVIYANTKQPLSVGLLGLCLFLSFWSYRDFFSLISFIYPILFAIGGFRFFISRKRFRPTFLSIPT